MTRKFIYILLVAQLVLIQKISAQCEFMCDIGAFFTKDGGTTYTDIIWVDQACNLDIEGTASWYTVTQVTNSIKIVCQANTGALRSDNFTIGGESFMITQAAACQVPAPVSINGSSSICKNSTNVQYSVTNVSGETYNWTITGGTIISGQGTSDIRVNFGESSSASISLIASNSCGSSNQINKSVQLNGPSAPGSLISPSSTICPDESHTFTVSTASGATQYKWYTGAGVTTTSTPSASLFVSSEDATIGVKVSDGTCESNIKDFDLNMHQAILKYSVTGGGEFCTGGSGVEVRLADSESNVTYQLKRGSTVVNSKAGTGSELNWGNQTNGGTYTVLASRNGCSVDMNGSAAVTVKPLPNASISANTTELSCVNPTATLTASGGTSYVWSTSSTSPSISVSPTTNETYKVTVTNNGCSSAAEETIHYNTLQVPASVSGPASQVCSDNTYSFTVSSVEGATEYIWTTSTETKTTTGTTTDLYITQFDESISVKASNGCSTSPEKRFYPSIYPELMLFSVTGGMNICGSGTIGTDGSETGIQYSLYRDGNLVYSGKEGNGLPLVFNTYNIPGTYTVIASNGTCEKTMEGSAVIYPDISANISTDQSYVNCVETQTTLNATGGNSYVWSTAQTSSSIIVTPLETTTYYVTATGDGGCQDYASFTVDFTGNLTRVIEQPVHVTMEESNLVSFGILAGGTELTYQWQYSTDGGATYHDLVGETGTSYTTTADLDMNGYQYLCVINGTCGEESSNPATLTVERFNLEKYTPASPSIEHNYKHEIIVQEALTKNEFDLALEDDATTINNKELAAGDIMHQLTYYDGLGRPSQSVAYRTSGYGYDVNQAFEYDEFGRESRTYLPYTKGTKGYFKTDALLGLDSKYETSAQKTFYENTENIAHDPNPYADIEFESSPLNRPVEQGAPGVNWQIKTDGTGNTVRFNYETNKSNEVIFFDVDDHNNLVKTGFYEKGTLRKTATRDENGIWSAEFKNMKGQVLLTMSDTTHLKLKTYYVYDDYGLLRYVIPPKAVELISQTTGTVDTNIIGNLCYYYEHDARKRMVLKKLPGAAPVYMIYDDRDRLVLTQDGNQRNDSSWIFTKYDAFNRPVITGIYNYNDTISLSSMQDTVNLKLQDGTYKFYETYDGVSFENFGYTNLAFPDLDSSDEILTVTYYDHYSFDEDSSIQTYCRSINSADYPVSEINRKVKGQITGMYTKILGTVDEYLLSVNLYDDKYRLLRTYTQNYTGGDDLLLNKYDFAGKILKSQQIHVKSFGSTPVIIDQRFNYDHANRPDSIFHQIGSNEEICMAAMEYNELGQLISRKLHKTAPDTYLQDIGYKYNIRGWLTDINDVSNMSDDLFAMQLAYNNEIAGVSTTADAQHNGNISAMVWSALKNRQEIVIKNESINSEIVSNYEIELLPGATLLSGSKLIVDPGATVKADSLSAHKQAYAFRYDQVNRIKKGDYKVDTSAWANPNSFDLEEVNYDENGNITLLKRYNENGTYLDDLVYDYLSGGNYTNQLRNVSDYGDAVNGFYDQTNAGIDEEYLYDPNGNMIVDDNKGHDVYYNYLNLPGEIDFGNGNKIEYIYNAAGVKLAKKTYKSGSLSMEVVYNGNIIYEDPTGSDFTLLTSEGKVSVTGTENTYEYYLKDHLGNTRVMFHEDGTGSIIVDQVNNYYPFGMLFEKQNLDRNKFLYNGKELQEDVFNGVAFDWYDYGWRFYDPAIARWHVIDPKAEEFFNLSPYVYVSNNPIFYIDPDGKQQEPGWFLRPITVRIQARGNEIADKQIKSGMNPSDALISGYTQASAEYFGSMLVVVGAGAISSKVASFFVTSAPTVTANLLTTLAVSPEILLYLSVRFPNLPGNLIAILNEIAPSGSTQGLGAFSIKEQEKLRAMLMKVILQLQGDTTDQGSDNSNADESSKPSDASNTDNKSNQNNDSENDDQKEDKKEKEEDDK